MYTINLETRIVLGIMLAAVVLVPLVACANAANPLPLRTLSWRQELAVRVAPASRSRIALHLLAQSLPPTIATAIALPLATLAMRHEGQLPRSSPNGVAEWLSSSLESRCDGCRRGAADRARDRPAAGARARYRAGTLRTAAATRAARSCA